MPVAKWYLYDISLPNKICPTTVDDFDYTCNLITFARHCTLRILLERSLQNIDLLYNLL